MTDQRVKHPCHTVLITSQTQGAPPLPAPGALISPECSLELGKWGTVTLSLSSIPVEGENPPCLGFGLSPLLFSGSTQHPMPVVPVDALSLPGSPLPQVQFISSFLMHLPLKGPRIPPLATYTSLPLPALPLLPAVSPSPEGSQGPCRSQVSPLLLGPSLAL